VTLGVPPGILEDVLSGMRKGQNPVARKNLEAWRASKKKDREAKAAARLSHPHVVGVLDQGEDGRLAYLVMEFIKGHTLRDVLNDKGALSPEEYQREAAMAANATAKVQQAAARLEPSAADLGVALPLEGDAKTAARRTGRKAEESDQRTRGGGSKRCSACYARDDAERQLGLSRFLRFHIQDGYFDA